MIRPETLSIRFLRATRPTLDAAFRTLGVDPYGIRIMLPKAIPYVIHLGPVAYPAALILKQEMLSQGGECALSRETITGRVKETRCILIGNATHYARLIQKLRHQPFGLAAISGSLSQAIDNYENSSHRIDLRRTTLTIRKRPLIMGIINLTPDSFSGDGMYAVRLQEVIRRAQQMVDDGADIIDIGAESSRPGATAVTLRQELARVIPAVRALEKKLCVPLSVDTYKPEVARQALDNGCEIINDITGLRNPAMAKICAQYRCGVVIMHMKGTPATMKRHARYASVTTEVFDFFRDRIMCAEKSGIAPTRIILDPGIGFAKNCRHNLEILANLRQFKTLGRPLLVGVSRKSFIGAILNDIPPAERLAGSLAACSVAASHGAGILRVHDVKETAHAVKTACAIMDCS